MRIAFAHIPGEEWSAGTYYLKNLFYALRSLSVQLQPEIVLLVPGNTPEEAYEELAPYIDEVLYRPEIERTFFVELANNVRKKVGFFPAKVNPLSAHLKSNGVDAFFTRGAPPANFILPFFSWIPDFQYLHFPEFFSEKERIKLNETYECSARDATRIIVSSNDSLKDFNQFASWAVNKARVLSFAAQIPDDIYRDNPEIVCRKYTLPERFILLPNQFWKHKNHETVVRALHIALQKEPELTIVCTGNTNEYRDLSYFSKLLCLLSNTGVRERMVILGLVPRQDLFMLMRQAMAVIQPSLFEGWNTTVEEVKSLGKKLIVSDISVHREQAPPDALYFKPTDVQSLAVFLQDIFTSGQPGPDYELEKAAKESLMTRTEQFGMKFLQIVQETLRN